MTPMNPLTPDQDQDQDQDQGRSPWYRVREIRLSGREDLTAVVDVPAESGWFSGHFPGNPVLPGIAQMGIVFDLMKQVMAPGLLLSGFKRVRFKQLIRPDTAITVEVKPQVRETGTFAFRIMVAQELCCSGFVRASTNFINDKGDSFK
ncbi:MAG: hydroxymyristoyl-ACP dehydratase [Pseudomonadota bacterium]